nr:MAG TPA: hypothetical protein [Caudoviricetes sp.]
MHSPPLNKNGYFSGFDSSGLKFARKIFLESRMRGVQPWESCRCITHILM